MTGPLLESPVDLERAVADRPPHLPCQFRRDGIDVGLHRLDHLADQHNSLGRRSRPPAGLRGLRPSENCLDLFGGRGGPLCIDGTVNRGDDLLKSHERRGYELSHRGYRIDPLDPPGRTEANHCGTDRAEIVV